jgi:uncharacterized peroxidase-related enzyme
MSAWIEMISDEQASPELAALLDRVRAPAGTVDNVMRVHSLRPHTMIGHHVLYRSVLHHEGNVLDDWLLETIASYTSILNNCAYSLANHWANARHLIGDEARAHAIHEALTADEPERVFQGKELAFMRYTRALTLNPGGMQESDVAAMRAEGAGDGEILEVNQVCCYFNYVNRLLNGLGVSLQGDTIGYYAAPDHPKALP